MTYTPPGWIEELRRLGLWLEWSLEQQPVYTREERRAFVAACLRLHGDDA